MIRILPIALTLAALAMPLHAQATTLYVYELPDGTRLVTDHLQHKKGYRLLYVNGSAKGVGAVASGRTPRPMMANRNAYDELIQHAAGTHRLDPRLIKAVIHAESGFNPNAVSRKGASGLMQLMPQTAAHYGVQNLFDPQQNVLGGTQYLSDLLRRYRNDVTLALAAYNAGEAAVLRYNGVPPYPETQGYVRKVLHFKRGRYAAFGRRDRTELAGLE